METHLQQQLFTNIQTNIKRDIKNAKPKSKLCFAEKLSLFCNHITKFYTKVCIGVLEISLSDIYRKGPWLASHLKLEIVHVSEAKACYLPPVKSFNVQTHDDDKNVIGK
jgi:hypothetical protein